MKINIFCRVLLICINLISLSVCYSAETSKNPCPLSSYTNHGYQHTSIQKQIEEYRHIYDEILQENSSDPYQTHSPRFFEKLQNAFRLTRQYILGSEVWDPDGNKQEQNIYLTYLKTLYNAACKLNKNKEMTPRYFERVNLLCALIGTQYRHYDAGNRFFAAATWHLWTGKDILLETQEELAEASLRGGVESTLSFIKTKMSQARTPGNYDHIRVKGFFPLAILYMDKDIGIGYQTFVKQFFTGNYPLFLATFFPSSVPTTHEELVNRKERKQDVHFSHVLSLFTMLAHDFEHRDIELGLLEFFTQRYRTSWIEYLRPAYEAISKISLKNGKIVYAGLFLLIHEFQYLDIPLTKWKEFHLSKQFDLLEFVIKDYQNSIKSKLEKRGGNNYKVQMRDNEHVLRWAKNEKGKTFIPLIKVEGKERFLPIAKDENGIPVIVLEVDPSSTIVKVRFFDQGATKEIPYITGSENNITLPEGWTWMTREEQRVPEQFHSTSEGRQILRERGFKEYEITKISYDKERQKKVDLNNLRQTHAAEYVMKGFNDFWDEFKKLVAPHYSE
jgi:hypothetical protein